MCICAETTILSRKGFTGSVTKAWRIDVVMGSRRPDSFATTLDQPAVALSTTPHEMSPFVVRTPRHRPPETSKPVTSTPWWMSIPARPTSLA